MKTMYYYNHLSKIPLLISLNPIQYKIAFVFKQNKLAIYDLIDLVKNHSNKIEEYCTAIHKPLFLFWSRNSDSFIHSISFLGIANNRNLEILKVDFNSINRISNLYEFDYIFIPPYFEYNNKNFINYLDNRYQLWTLNIESKKNNNKKENCQKSLLKTDFLYLFEDNQPSAINQITKYVYVV